MRLVKKLMINNYVQTLAPLGQSLDTIFYLISTAYILHALFSR
jgi:hypothetical protein